jgi:acyl-coenzyme A thioesterase PaaI-like protein
VAEACRQETHLALGEELRKRKKRSLEKGHPLLEASGLEVLELDRGLARVRMPIAINANHIGTFYAGSLVVLAEVTGAALFSGSFDSKRFYPIVKDIHTTFRRPAKTDVTAEAQLDDREIISLADRAERDGKVDHRLILEMRDASGVVVAETESVFQLRARAPASGSDEPRS